MAAFFADYGLFLLKAITIVIAVGAIITIAAFFFITLKSVGLWMPLMSKLMQMF